MYAKCSSMQEARKVFDELDCRRDLVSWNSLLQGYVDNGESELALQLYEDMQIEGDARTYVAALTACSSTLAALEKDGKCSEEARVKTISKGQRIHSLAVSQRCCNIFVETALVGMYAKCGSIEKARGVFDGMAERNIVSWNALLHGCVDNGKCELAVRLFEGMQNAPGGCVPDARSYVAALTACANLATELRDPKYARDRRRWLEKGVAAHSQAVHARCYNVFVQSSLVDMYSKFGWMSRAQNIFNIMVQPNVVCWNALIMGYVENGENSKALEMITEMNSRGVARDSLTYVAGLMACGSLMAVEHGETFHAEIRARKLEGHLVVANCLVDFYGKCGCVDSAKQVFDSIPRKTVVSWTSLMCGYSLQGEAERVFALLERMKEQGVPPNEVTFVCVLTACSHAGLTDRGREYFSSMKLEYGIIPNVKHYACMADLLGRANCLKEAMKMVRGMPFQPDAVVWKAVLSACRKWNNVEAGKVAYECLLRVNERDAAAYVLMANTFGGGGGGGGDSERTNIFSRKACARQVGGTGQTWWTDKGGKVHKFVTGESGEIK